MPIVLAAPITGPSFAGAGTTPRFMSWTGVDGSVWPLTRPQAINPRMAPGVKGLHMPRMDVYKTSTPLVSGVDLTGYSLPERSVYWPLRFRASNIDEWQAAYAGFFDSFHPVETGIWTVGRGANARTLPLTGVFDGEYSFVGDPFVTGRAEIGIELSAPRPLWRGQAIRREFGSDEGVDFIPPEGAPSFNLSPAVSFQEASIPNPGDEPAYLVWTVMGPLDEVQLGVGGSIVEVPFAVPDGSTLRIDTDPAAQFATLDGVDATAELGFQMFAPVPAKGSTPLLIAATGEGFVGAELVPLYWRAF